MDIKPVPAFYCCYLLRSTIRHAALYIGSTPNPKRRLAQHNGLVKGGAFKTSRDTLRPWEMVCIVTGFPSNIAALQFEWTWQNPHLTRRIVEEDRITIRETITKMSRSGKPRKRPARPRMSLKDRLANLHLLLQVPSFANWPLQVRFFNKDVYEVWLKYLENRNGELSRPIEVVVDTEDSKFAPTSETLGIPARIAALEVGYERYKNHLEKSAFLLADGEHVHCDICQEQIQAPGHMALTCSHGECRSASHLACLSQRFLEEDRSGALMPKSGDCPSCKNKLQWSDLVTELSLRIRGEKETTKLMKKRRQRKPKDNGTALNDVLDEDEEDEEIEDEDDQNQDLDNLRLIDVIDEPLREDYKDDFLDIDDFSSDDASSVTSALSEQSVSKPTRTVPQFKVPPTLQMVIEDSEYDSAEELD